MLEEKTIFEGIEVEVLRNFHPDGSLNMEWTQTQYQLHGFSRKYFVNGQLAEERIYKYGKKTEHDFSFFPNGSIKSRVVRIDENTLKHLGYFENGVLSSEFFRNSQDKIVIHNKKWHPNGQLASEYYFSENGIGIGIFRQYFEDGTLKLEGEYFDGEPHYYNAFRNPGEQVLKNGDGLLITNFSGVKFDHKSECQVKNGLRNGTSRTFQNGKLRSETNYLNGKAEGKSTEYNPDGTIKEYSYFVNGQFVKREKPE